jgi:uncharacterized protein (DUF697 family)/tellurite resistance protein
MNDEEQAAVLTIALMAAGADGSQSAQEKAQLQALAALGAPVDLGAIGQQLATGQLTLAELARRLPDETLRHRAYEVALLVCNADGPANPKEDSFLAELRTALGLTPSALQPLEASTRGLATAAATPPPAVAASVRPTSDAALDDTILQQAMLTGALEVLPDSLASMAILPLQLRLVYQVGQHYGQALDANQVQDLAGTLGIGAAAQMVEGVVRKVLGGLASGFLGGLLGGATGLAAGATVSFAATYALGHVAKQYYAQGRRLSAEDLRALFLRFQEEARGMLPRVQSQIQGMAGRLNVQDVIHELRPR